MIQHLKYFFLTVLTFFLCATLSFSAVYELPPLENNIIGSIKTIKAEHEDTLLDIARRHGLGYEDIVKANPGLDIWIPGKDSDVLLPTKYILPNVRREGLVLNLAEYRMYYFPVPKKNEKPIVITYPISIGRMDWDTPLGETRITAKAKNPSWYPPESIRAEHEAEGDPLPRIVPPGPDNPLGEYAMRLDIPGYLIHGTNRPAGVGMRVTHGCIRMYPEDIFFLYNELKIGTPVRIINEPIKLGWDERKLFLEVHNSLDSKREVNKSFLYENDNPPKKHNLTILTEKIIAVTEENNRDAIDWQMAETILVDPSGIPVIIGSKHPKAMQGRAFK
jgi:L,D-transpeptidase ErfK/SrfK